MTQVQTCALLMCIIHVHSAAYAIIFLAAIVLVKGKRKTRQAKVSMQFSASKLLRVKSIVAVFHTQLREQLRGLPEVLQRPAVPALHLNCQHAAPVEPQQHSFAPASGTGVQAAAETVVETSVCFQQLELASQHQTAHLGHLALSESQAHSDCLALSESQAQLVA